MYFVENLSVENRKCSILNIWSIIYMMQVVCYSVISGFFNIE